MMKKQGPWMAVVLAIVCLTLTPAKAEESTRFATEWPPYMTEARLKLEPCDLKKDDRTARFTGLLRRLGFTNPELILAQDPVPATLPAGAYGKFAWGQNPKAVTQYMVTPAEEPGMYGLMYVIKPGWVIHLEVGTGGNVIAFFGMVPMAPETVVGKPGEKGDKGDTGPPGPTGATGPAGPAGAAGQVTQTQTVNVTVVQNNTTTRFMSGPSSSGGCLSAGTVSNSGSVPGAPWTPIGNLSAWVVDRPKQAPAKTPPPPPPPPVKPPDKPVVCPPPTVVPNPTDLPPAPPATVPPPTDTTFPHDPGGGAPENGNGVNVPGGPKGPLIPTVTIPAPGSITALPGQ